VLGGKRAFRDGRFPHRDGPLKDRVGRELRGDGRVELLIVLNPALSFVFRK
jgi:hypothetical protein